MPHFFDHPAATDPNMHWDDDDQLQQVDLDGGTAHYTYDSTGERVRKVVERPGGAIEERIYLGGFEVYRRHNGNGQLTLERETLHIMDDQQKIGLVETRTVGTDQSRRQFIRYQLGIHFPW